MVIRNGKHVMKVGAFGRGKAKEQREPSTEGGGLEAERERAEIGDPGTSYLFLRNVDNKRDLLTGYCIGTGLLGG